MLERIISKLNTQRILVFIYIAVLLFGVSASFNNNDGFVDVFSMPASGKVVVIDAGHGGWDPGKVAPDNTLEKNINVAISLKLQQYLEQGDCFVLMTRVGDSALGDKKMSDMTGRKDIVNSSGGDLLVSIHQNSFTKESVSGPQVFYYDNSPESRKLAEFIQLRLVEFLEVSKKRVAKPNDGYYMLKQTAIPAVIVECGFLSNDDERSKLLDEKYQQKIAWAIYMGVLDYFEERNFDNNTNIQKQ